MSVQQRARLRHQRDIPGRDFDAGVMQWLVDQQLGAEHVMAYRLTVNPDSTASHAHPGAEEVMYVLEGSGEIRVEAADHVVGPGQAVFVPDGAAHSYVNTGADPLVVVGAMAPPVDPAQIRPAIPRLDLSGLPSAGPDERGVAPTMMDERQLPPPLMAERTFRVLVNPTVGCQRISQLTGGIPTRRAPVH